MVGDDEYWVPEHVRDYLRGLGFVLPLEPMEQDKGALRAPGILRRNSACRVRFRW